MKLLVVGAGAVGGIVAAQLARDHDLTLVARGPNLEAIRTRGLTVHAPDGTRVVKLAVVDKPVVDADTTILLAVKTQDAPDALRSLATVAPASTPVVCLTNGIEAERMALRWFDRVYAMCVNIPAAHLEPGVVESWGTPMVGLFDVGCYPHGTDATCEALAAAFEAANMSSRVLADVMAWKRAKLVFNLSNALEALCGPAGRTHAIVDELRAEAARVFSAAGLATPSDDKVQRRRGEFRTGTIAGRTRTGGSTWQSLQRGAAILECEYLNGEIALLGRLHAVPTPLNDALVREVTRAAAAGLRPGSLEAEVVAQRLTHSTSPITRDGTS